MMAIRPICLFPEPVLRSGIKKVEDFEDPFLKVLIKDLSDTMKSQKHGIGIAAPQIGVPLKVAIVDLRSRDSKAQSYVLINPRVLEKSNETLASREGCMSLPDYTADLKRYAWVLVEWFDVTGKKHQERFSGIEGICFQHEIDHLNGKLFLDRVACLKTDMYARQLQNTKKVKK